MFAITLTIMTLQPKLVGPVAQMKPIEAILSLIILAILAKATVNLVWMTSYVCLAKVTLF